jgi:hypothetical protein
VASSLCTACFVQTHGADSLLALARETSRRGFVTFRLDGLVSRFPRGALDLLLYPLATNHLTLYAGCCLSCCARRLTCVRAVT